MGKGKFAGFTQQSAEPEYPAPVAANVPLEPAPAPKRAKPAVAAAAHARIDHADLSALLYAQGYGADEIVATPV